jgi:O-antigen ligase
MDAMNTLTRRLLLILLLLGIAAGSLGLAGVLSERQIALRGALAGLPDRALPPRTTGLGVNADLTQYDQSQLGENLDLIKKTGFSWVRQVFAWDTIERRQGSYDWSAYDRVVTAAIERKLRLVAVLWRSPGWAAASPTAPPGDMKTLSAFAGALAGRYGSQIDLYQIWDEPNLSSGWGDQPPDPVRYARVLEAAYAPIHAADPHALVLAAGLAPNVEQGPDNLSDILYLRALYDNGAGPFFDGVAGKPYGYDSGPSDRRVDEGLLNFSRFVLLREEMERRGDSAKPLWASHFGWNSLPAGWKGSPSVWGQVSAQDQAAWTVEAYERALAEWPWAGPLFLENWQPALPANDPHWGFALRQPDGRLSPAAQALAQSAVKFNQALWPGVYPAATPLASYGGQWEFSDLGADIVQNGNSALDIPFAGDSLAVIARRGQYRAYLYVSVDGQRSSVLPHDEQGQAYQVLASTDNQPHTEVLTLAAASHNTGPHRTHIQADRGWDQWAIAGFVVGWTPDTSSYDLLLGTLGGMWIVLVAVFVLYARRLEAPALAARLIGWLRDRLSQGLHLALSVVAALALWLGMALTWGGGVPGLLRRMGDVPSLLLTALTAGVFYFSPWLLLAILALIVLFILIYSRPAVGLALIMAFTPTYLLPRPLFDRMFSLLEVTTLLTLAAWAIHFAGDRREKGWPSLLEFWLRTTMLDRALMSFVLLGVPALAWSDLKGVAITDLRQMILEPAVMYLILRTTPLSERERWQIIHLLILTGVAVALAGFYQFAVEWAKSPGQFTCLHSTFGTCNNAALYLERLVPITAAVVLIGRDQTKRRLYAAAGILMIAATVLTVSRGGLLFGLPVALALVVILWAGRPGMIAAAVGFVLEVLIVIPLSIFVPRFSNMFDLSSGSSSSFFRTQIWQSTFQMLKDHPITGVGLDQFLYQYRGRYILPTAWQQPDLSQPHNFLLDYWVRLGLLGLAAGVWLQIAFWRLAWATQGRLRSANPESRALAVGLMGGVAAMIVHGMVDETHFVIDLAFIFCMTLGMMHQLSMEAFNGLDGQRASSAAG